MENKIKVVQMGLGPIGRKVTQYLTERSNIEIRGAIDADPAIAGQDVGALAGTPPLGVKVTADMERVLGGGNADVVVLTTTSRLDKIYEQLQQILPYGVHCVSSCEELSYPWATQPEISAGIDALAKKHGVAVLSTGVNPGFMMDFLPIAMSGICRNIRKVTVERIQDASARRIPFQQKIGAGLTLNEFHDRVKGGVLRHVGLTESMHMIASRLHWKLDRTEDLITPIIAETEVRVNRMTIAPGNARGVQQLGLGMADGKEVIRLVFRAAIGEAGSRDRIIIDGSPKIDTCVDGGVNGDVATCAILVNAVPAVLTARHGLRTMADIEPISCYH
jgi:4-hydroxy-tetrahydrodipicolinate reductase